MASVLVVDDDVACLTLAAKLLRRAGHTVLQADSGPTGLEQARTHLPNLMLLDLVLPEMDGWEVLRRLRTDPATAGLRVVALTAHVMAGDRERALAAGFDGFMPKPITVSRFVAQVEAHLSGVGPIPGEDTDDALAAAGLAAASPPGVAGAIAHPAAPVAGQVPDTPGTILVVDDVEQNVVLLQKALRTLGHRVITAAGGPEALRALAQEVPDLVLTDVMMPVIDGFDLCRRIKADPATRFVPVVLVTALSEVSDRVRGIEAGADDFLSKPVNREELLARTRSLMRLKRAIDELEDSENIIRTLAGVVEAKDMYTEQHTQRVAQYAVAIGGRMGLPPDGLRHLQRAGFLHDVGKVAVPESILLKPGPLDAAESAVMQEHPVVGERICRPLRAAALILGAIRHHHERMDGRGYPDGLQGDAIPLFARILAVADAFDAMTTDRPYRKGLSYAHATAALRNGAGTQWDGQVVAVFLGWLALGSSA